MQHFPQGLGLRENGYILKAPINEIFYLAPTEDVEDLENLGLGGSS